MLRDNARYLGIAILKLNSFRPRNGFGIIGRLLGENYHLVPVMHSAQRSRTVRHLNAVALHRIAEIPLPKTFSGSSIPNISYS